MESIMQSDKNTCYLCDGKAYWTDNDMLDRLEEHHVFGGNPGRKLSERYGLKVYLHGIKCHREGQKSAHKSRCTREFLQSEGQKAFERVHGSRQEFMKVFGKNYL